MKWFKLNIWFRRFSQHMKIELNRKFPMLFFRTHSVSVVEPINFGASIWISSKFNCSTNVVVVIRMGLTWLNRTGSIQEQYDHCIFSHSRCSGFFFLILFYFLIISLICDDCIFYFCYYDHGFILINVEKLKIKSKWWTFKTYMFLDINLESSNNFLVFYTESVDHPTIYY